ASCHWKSIQIPSTTSQLYTKCNCQTSSNHSRWSFCTLHSLAPTTTHTFLPVRKGSMRIAHTKTSHAAQWNIVVSPLSNLDMDNKMNRWSNSCTIIPCRNPPVDRTRDVTPKGVVTCNFSTLPQKPVISVCCGHPVGLSKPRLIGTACIVLSTEFKNKFKCYEFIFNN
ncbi:hypothetical protein MJO29_012893, partial [Puccinia striiformis f. sp. tritici]